MDSDARILKGINIAAIILSALGALAALIAVVCGIVGAVFVGDTQFTDMMYYELSGSSSYDPYSEAILVSAFASSLVFVCIFIALLGVALKGAALTAGIFGMQAASDPQRRGAAFIWAIVAAVLNGLIGSFISMVLFIVSAVYINKMRKTEGRPFQNQAPYFGSQPQGFSQSPYRSAHQAPSQQPYAQQTQPHAPVQPAPYSGQVPVQQAPYQAQVPMQPAPFVEQVPAQPAPFVEGAPVQPVSCPCAAQDDQTVSRSEDGPTVDQEGILNAEKHNEAVVAASDERVPEVDAPDTSGEDLEANRSSENDATAKKD